MQKPQLITMKEFANRKGLERQQRESAIKERTRKKDLCSVKLASLRGDLEKTHAALARAEADLAASDASTHFSMLQSFN